MGLGAVWSHWATLQAWLGQTDGVPSPNLPRSLPHPSACPCERDPHLAQTTVGPEHSLKLGLAVARESGLGEDDRSVPRGAVCLPGLFFLALQGPDATCKTLSSLCPALSVRTPAKPSPEGDTEWRAAVQGGHPSPTTLHPLCVQGPGHVTRTEAVQAHPCQNGPARLPGQPRRGTEPCCVPLVAARKGCSCFTPQGGHSDGHLPWASPRKLFL